jgi:hypothetical protein
MDTASLFSELRLLIPELHNCAPANPQLLHLSAADVTHLGEDHWENLQDALGLKTVFGWDERGGILSASSSKADFQLVFEFLERLHLAEGDVPPQESCSGQLETRLKGTVLIWYGYSWEVFVHQLMCISSQQAPHAAFAANRSSSTQTPIPVEGVSGR